MDDVRYIILPGGIRKDDRLSLSHFKVAMVLGAYSKRHGWTDLTQNDVGEMAGLSRETVCRCVGDLVDWGWVARRKKNKKNQYVYRFIMDRDDYCEPAVTEPSEQCDEPVTGNVSSSFTFNKEDSSTLRGSTSVPLPLTPEHGSSEVGQGLNMDLEGKGRTIGILRIRPGEGAWSQWIEHIKRKLGEKAAEDAAAMGQLEVVTRWPNDATPMPRIARNAP